MREFIYFSKKAKTTGNWEDLMEAGRMDIVFNVIIHTFFVSNAMRRDTKLHLIFYGPPNAPRHIELNFNEQTPISKKDLGGLIKRILYKGENLKKGQRIEAFSGCYIENKSFFEVINNMRDKGKEIMVLDGRGEDIRELDDKELENAVFVMGDEEGLPKKEYQRLRKKEKLVSVGNATYFTSQTVILVHNELDRRFELKWKKRSS